MDIIMRGFEKSRFFFSRSLRRSEELMLKRARILRGEKRRLIQSDYLSIISRISITRAL